MELGRTTYNENLHLRMCSLLQTRQTGSRSTRQCPTCNWANGADQDITTLESEMDAAEARLTALEAGGGGGGVSAPPKRLKVFCDASYSGENGNADGSLLKPYTTLQAAATAELTEGSTQHITFKLAPAPTPDRSTSRNKQRASTLQWRVQPRRHVCASWNVLRKRQRQRRRLPATIQGRNL